MLQERLTNPAIISTEYKLLDEIDIHWCAKLKQQCKNLADSHEIAEKVVWRSVQ
jgi:hypothetical protein